MKRTWGPFLTCVILSIVWYLGVGAFDRFLMSHDYQTFSAYCYKEHLPPGTVHNPEGYPSAPVGTYEFLPLGVECTFQMVGGTLANSFYVRYYPLVLACIPATAIVVWGASIIGNWDRRTSRDRACLHLAPR